MNGTNEQVICITLVFPSVLLYECIMLMAWPTVLKLSVASANDSPRHLEFRHARCWLVAHRHQGLCKQFMISLRPIKASLQPVVSLQAVQLLAICQQAGSNFLD